MKPILKPGDSVCARVFCRNFCGTVAFVTGDIVTILGGWCTDKQTEVFNNGGELPVITPWSSEFHVGNTWIAGSASFTAPEHEPVVYSNQHLLEKLREWQEDDQC